MRQKKYRLQVVLKVREKKKDEAARFVAKRREELFEAEQELLLCKSFLKDCRQQISDANNRMMSEFDDGIAAGNIVAHRNFLQVLKEREQELIISVENQKAEVRKAEIAVDEALNKLSEASKELKVIEKHKDRWIETKKTELKKRDQKLSDEIGAILHQNSKKL